jgi:iron complex outermembrane receptor protein
MHFHRPSRTFKNVSGTGMKIACATSVIAFVWAVPATAQDATEPVPSEAAAGAGSEIVVTGLRGSLQRNLDLKRSATGVVDVISSEDIGKFPDSNVAASLQRLPGVSIQRSGARGEPTGITVRGFGGDFNTTLFDGRRIATATGGRQIDFSTVGSDFVGSISVMKTPDVALSSNSIGATVDIAFPKPFDKPGFRAAVSGSGSIQDRAGKVVPTAGILLSNTWNDQFGVLADFIYTRRDTDTNRVYVAGWPGNNFAPCQLAGSTAATCNPQPVGDGVSASNAATLTGWFPQQYGAEQQRVQDERIDARLALQWQPSDGIMVTLDNNFSRQKVQSNNYAFGVWFNQGSLRNVTLDENGTAVDFTQTGTPTDFTSALNTEILKTNQTGINIKYEASENLSFLLDGAYAKSWRNPNGNIGSRNADVGYGGALGNNLRFVVDGDSKNAFPSISNFGPAGDSARWADTSLIGSHVAVNQTQENTDELWQLRGAGTWTQDNLTIDFGGQYYQDTFDFLNRSTFTNNFWQAYSGYGSPSQQGGGINPLPANLFRGSVSLNNFISGFNGSLPPSVFIIDPVEYQNYLSSLGNPQAQNIQGYNYEGVQGFTGTFDEAVDPGSVLNVRERTWSLFLKARFEAEIAGMPFFFNAGIRNEHTSLRAVGRGRLPVSLSTSAADPTLLTTAYNTNNPEAVVSSSSYSYLLPSFDARLEITPQFIARLGASRTLTRPTLNLLNPVLNVGNGQRIGALNASGGNPNLRPFLADNFDVAFEWYYARNSYFSVNAFLKNVSNFIVSGVSNQTINDVIDPTTGRPAVFAVSQQLNGPDATVRGLELAWQQVFGDTGFGFQANVTLVGSNREYDASVIDQSGFAVTGLANSANFVGFYDKNGFQIRAAVNWRDEYLLQFGQNQNTGGFGSEPTFVDKAIQVDLTSSYDINENFSVFGEVLNINKNKQSTHGRFKNQLLDVFDYGRRYTLGVRFRY